ncbi:MAG: hypothetical protein AAGL34_15305 [Bacteroidota bacterium]
MYYILIVLLLGSSYTQAQQFVKVGGQATDIAMSPKDGSVYVVNASKNIKKYDTRSKKFLPYATQSKNATSVSVTKDGVVYMVSTGKEVSLASNGRWIKIHGIKTSEVICLKDGTIMALDVNKKLRRLYASKWNLTTGLNNERGGVNQVIGTSINDLNVRMSDNAFKRYSRGNLYNLNGKPLKIALDHKTGIVYAVGKNKGIYKWVKSTKKWVLLAGTRKDFKDVAVHNGKIWAVATNKAIYYYDPDKKGVTSNNNDLSGTYRVFIEKLGSYKKGGEFHGVMGVHLKTKIKSGQVPISPLHGKKNRFWDYPKGSPKAANDKGFFIGKTLNSTSKNVMCKASIDIDKVREFKIVGEAAMGNPTLDFQLNLRSKILFEHYGEWERFKLPLKNIEFGKMYYLAHFSSKIGAILSFKVEKL